MEKQNLKTHCQNFYRKQKFNQHKLDQLIELTDNINTTEKNTHLPSQSNFTWRSVAAAVFVAVTLSVGVQQYSTDNMSTLIQLITSHQKIVPQEIALNHSKHLALEFNSDNYYSLNKMMPKLDFQLKASENIQLASLTIQGSRYCSIQGNLAAQIRLTDNKDNTYTLYQTPLTAALMAEKTGTFITNGVTISQWREDNIFFGLAHTTLPHQFQ